MDLDLLITRLTSEIHRRLQAEEDRPNLLIFAPRAGAAGLILPAELAAGRCCYADDTERPARISRRIMPQLTIAQQAGLAQGQAVDLLSRALLAEILAGHQVEVLAYEYHGYRASAPAALIDLYDGQVRQLALFGIRPYQAAGRTEATAPADCKRLITERDILAIVATGAKHYRLHKGCRLTPLAADCARDNHLLLERDEEGGSHAHR